MGSLGPPVAAYDGFDPPLGSPAKAVTTTPGAGVAKVAVVDSGGLKYVYVAWWDHNSPLPSELRFRRLVSASEEGQGPWTESEEVLGTTTFATLSVPLLDLAIAAYGNEVYVAWMDQSDPPKVRVARSVDNGQSFPLVWTPADVPGTSYRMPDLVATDTRVWLARVAFSPGAPSDVEVVRLKPSPEVRMAVTAATDPGQGAQWPSLAAFEDTVHIAYDSCSDCADPSTRHVYVVTCIDVVVCQGPATQVSAGAPTPSVAPDIAAHRNHLHLVWQAGTDITYERGAHGIWEASTRHAVAGTGGLAEGQANYGIAAHGYAVAVAYITGPGSPPRSARNPFHGHPSAWLSPEAIGLIAYEIDIAVDARHELSGEKGNILQYVWTEANGVEIAHRRIPTEERQRQATLFADISVGQGQAAVLGHFGGLPHAFVFGGEVPALTDKIWRFDTTSEFPPIDTGHRLWMPSSYTSAVWTGSSAVIFWGRTATGTSCVQIYTTSGNAFCPNLSDQVDRHATSAVYDGTRYAYVFGGKTSTGTYLDWITKWDVTTSDYGGWPPTCPAPVLEAATAFTSAAWDPVRQVAFIFGGEQAGVPPTNSPRNYYQVLQFDPNAIPCPEVSRVPGGFGIMPCEHWDPCAPEQVSVRPGPGTTAVYAGAGTILVAGGRHLYDPVLGGTWADSRYIYRFDTSTTLFTLKLVDLPACKSHGSAVWYEPASGVSRMYYFAGFKDPGSCSGGGDQVVRYAPDTH